MERERKKWRGQWEAVRRLFLKSASTHCTLLLVHDSGPGPHTFFCISDPSFQRQGKREKDYNLHAKYVMGVEMMSERYNEGRVRNCPLSISWMAR